MQSFSPKSATERPPCPKCGASMLLTRIVPKKLGINQRLLMRQLGYAITEGEMAYIRETEEFDQETLHILGNALDEAWRRVKSNHLNGRAYGARTVLAQHIFAMAKQGERDPHRLIDGALMRLTL